MRRLGTRQAGRVGPAVWCDPLISSHVVRHNGRPPWHLAKDTLVAGSVVESIVQGAGQIPVMRDNQDVSLAVQAAVADVLDGEAVLVYPKVTITKNPHPWSSSAKTEAAHLSLESGCPLVPLAQRRSRGTGIEWRSVR